MKLVKESISFERYRDPKKALGLKYIKPKYPLGSFSGLEKVAEDFMAFDIMDAKKDPEMDSVYMLLIRFTDNGEYGLCIYDQSRDYLIEEPAPLDDYNIDSDFKLNKLGFEVPEDLKFNKMDESSFERYRDPKSALGLDIYTLPIFDNTEQLVDYIIKLLPYIFDKIPKNIACEPRHGSYIIKPEYYNKINDFLNKCYDTNGQKVTEDYIEKKYEMWTDIFKFKLRDLGYNGAECLTND